MNQIAVTNKLAATLLASCLLILHSAFATGQTAITPPRAGQQDKTASIAEFEKKTNELQQQVTALPNEQPEKAGYQNQLAEATSALEQFKLDETQIEELQAEINNAEKLSINLTETIKESKGSDPEKSNAKEKPEQQDFSKLDLLDLKARKAEVEATILNLRNEQTKLQELTTSYQSRKENFDQRLLDVAQELETLGEAAANQADLASLPEKITSLVTAVKQIRLVQERTLITLKQQKRDTYKQLDIYQKQLESTSLQLANQEEIEKNVDAAIAAWREREAKDLAKEAEKTEKANAKEFPLLADSESKNVELAKDIGELESEATKVVESNRQLGLQYVDIYKKFETTADTVKLIRQSNTIGAMLRKRKAELPTPQSREQRAADARDRVEEIQANKFQDSEDLAELSIQSIREEVEESQPDLTDEQLDELFKPGRKLEPEEKLKPGEKLVKPEGSLVAPGKLYKPAEQLIERRKVLLNSRDKLYERLFEDYVALEATNSRVTGLVEKFGDFINERILWLRSSKMLFSDLKPDKADLTLLSIDKWEETKEPALESYRKRPWLTCIGGLVLLMLLVFRSKMRREVDALGQKAARGSCATFWPTSRAMVLTVLIAITVPLIFCGIGWVLKQSTPSQSRLFDAIATALMTAGLFAIPFEILRRTCRPDGLAVKHFNWPGAAVAKLKMHLSWYVLPASALVFAESLFARIDTAHRNDLIERCLFLVGILMTAWLFYRVLSPTDGIFSQYFKRNENSWVNQTKSIWISAIVLIPIALAVLAFTGYYYTALNLTYYLTLTFAFAVALELVRALIRRLVTVRQRAAFIESAKRKRKLEIEAAKEARKQAAAERKRRIEAGEELDETIAPVVPVETLAEMQFDFSEIKVNADHANQLIRLLGLTAWFFGLWMVWGDVLPAMKVLDEYKLWGTTTENVAPSEAASISPMPGMPAPEPAAKDSTAKADSQPQEAGDVASTAAVKKSPLDSLETPDKPGVSVRDLLVAIAIVLLTFVAARNLPNAFEMLFLEDLPFDRSARSASKALFSYGIVIFGAAFAMRTLSINWTNVQWLVTALTFGLAFGLQEIFANFVAGIILMFERPMRLGDLITVDDFTGFVTRIRTRATTVVNWDRKEYVIPNKDFITGRLINWTLSDAINRIELTVGVAYGSDVAKAKKLIFDICKSHPSIVDEPPTQITFEEFGDSTLNLVVRTYLNEVTSRLPVIDSLHMQINDKFNEAGIEIAFPQQDLHLRSIDEDLAKALASVKRSGNE